MNRFITQAELPQLLPGEVRWSGSFYSSEDAPSGYWGELDRAEFERLIECVRSSEDFDSAVMGFFAEHPRADLYPYAIDCEGRSSWFRLLNSHSKGAAVDIGAGMGAISEHLAGRFDSVYAIEGCEARCRLLAERRRMKQLDSLHIIHSGIGRLPIRAETIDLVACNGALEWAAAATAGQVRDVQLAALREMRRVLKKEGVLYVGIENRIARSYLRGARDHCGLPYTSLLPRFLASFVTRRHRPVDFAVDSGLYGYRTYTYTRHGYLKLLREAGFRNVVMLAAEPSYDLPVYAFPIRAGAADLNRFFEVFVHRHWYRLRDRALANNFFIFASPEGELPVDIRPTRFVFHGRVVMEGDEVIRLIDGFRPRREPIVQGRPLHVDPDPSVSTERIIDAYSSALQSNIEPPEGGIAPIIGPHMDVIAGRCLGDDLMGVLRERIAKSHSAVSYHGDFWIGNLMRDRTKGGLVLIDPQRHAFGSPQLDCADFLFDFLLHNRGDRFKGISLARLAEWFGVDREDRELFMLATLRRAIWYSSAGRPYNALGNVLRVLRRIATGKDLRLGDPAWWRAAWDG